MLKAREPSTRASPSGKPPRRPAAELSRRLREVADLPALLALLAHDLQVNTRLDGLLINLHRPESQSLVCTLAKLPDEFSAAEGAYKDYNFPVSGDDANAQCFAQQAMVTIKRDNVEHFSGRTRLRFERWKMSHLVILPLRSDTHASEPAGTLMLFVQRRTLSRATIRYAQALVAEVTPLIRLHLALNKWEQRARSIRDTEGELLELLQFVAEMSNLTTDSEIYPRIQDEFMRRFDLDMAAILMLEKNELRCVSHDFKPQQAHWVNIWRQQAPLVSYVLDAADGASSDVFLRNGLLYFADVPAVRDLPMSAKDRAVLLTLDDLQTFGMFPIRKQGLPIGVLWLGSFHRKQALSNENLALTQHLCDFLGAVIENARTYTLVQRQRQDIESLLNTTRNQVEVLDNLANRDQLTGLFNFGSFESEAKRHIQLYRQQAQPQAWSIIMCDVDFFKAFNDSYGHVAGNEVLKEMAGRIMRNVRENDYVARYGGEEFVILLPRCDIDAAFRLAERIRLSIEQQAFSIAGCTHHLTMSLGCAQYSPQFETAGEFIARADSALYAAKHGGRNQVKSA